MHLSLNDWAALSTIAASIVAAGALVYAAVQVHLNTRVSRAQFWLELRKMFADHKEIHLILRNGKWPNDDDAVITGGDWAKLEAYMGLLEHCEMMLRQKLIDWPTFNLIYGYRLDRILENELIVREKLFERRYGWKAFIELVGRMGDKAPAAKYLCGCWDRGEQEWKLWWGTVNKAFAVCRFASGAWDKLEAAYFVSLNDLKDKPGAITYAWLRKDGKTMHSWPEKTSCKGVWTLLSRSRFLQ